MMCHCVGTVQSSVCTRLRVICGGVEEWWQHLEQQLRAHILIHEQEAQRVLKPVPNDLFPPARPHLIPSKSHPLGTKDSNAEIYEGHFIQTLTLTELLRALRFSLPSNF